MKKLLQAFCSLFCVMSMTLPVDALAKADENRDDCVEEQRCLDAAQEDYQLVFVRGDFSLDRTSGEAGLLADHLVMFLQGPDGRLVKNAQVVATVIDVQGRQRMSRARPYLGGYQVAFAGMPAGLYRVETEVVTHGQLLTDEFTCRKA